MAKPTSPSAAAAAAAGSQRLRKRPRSNSIDAMSLHHILKACKHTNPASPHSTSGFANNSSSDEESTSTQVPTGSSEVKSCKTMRDAMMFLLRSRRQAVGLLAQNQWHRAVAVLEKIERANDMVARQRRKAVLEHANHEYLRELIRSSKGDEPEKPRKVRFSDEQPQCEEVEYVDRAPAPMQPFARDEILILRSSRPIPVENYSELWN